MDGKRISNWLVFDERKRVRKRPQEDHELTQSPVSGTYIIKEWTEAKRSRQTDNSLAASFIEITPQARARLARIPNRIGPFECKLCKVVYNDAFELALHDCPRVVHMEYK